MTRKPVMKVRFSRRENDFLIDFPAMVGGRQNASFVNSKLTREQPDFAALLSPTALEELERRGFDTKGIVITIPIKPEVLVIEGTTTLMYHPRWSARPSDSSPFPCFTDALVYQ